MGIRSTQTCPLYYIHVPYMYELIPELPCGEIVVSRVTNATIVFPGVVEIVTYHNHGFQPSLHLHNDIHMPGMGGTASWGAAVTAQRGGDNSDPH